MPHGPRARWNRPLDPTPARGSRPRKRSNTPHGPEKRTGSKAASARPPVAQVVTATVGVTPPTGSGVALLPETDCMRIIRAPELATPRLIALRLAAIRRPSVLMNECVSKPSRSSSSVGARSGSGSGPCCHRSRVMTANWEHHDVGSVPDLTLGWRLQMALRQGGVQVQEMADELGIGRSTLGRWINDHGAHPDPASSRCGRCGPASRCTGSAPGMKRPPPRMTWTGVVCCAPGGHSNPQRVCRTRRCPPFSGGECDLSHAAVRHRPPARPRALDRAAGSAASGVTGRGGRGPRARGRRQRALYSASVTCSSHVVVVVASSALSSMARCSIQHSGVAPCQCSSPGGV